MGQLDQQHVVDGLRVLLIVMGSGVIGSALVVVYSYVGVYRRHRALARDGKIAGWRGLLPRHVSVIGGSHLMMVAGSIADVTGHIHSPFTWRIPLYAVSYSLSLWAMRDMLAYQQNRKHDFTPPPKVS